MRVITPADNLDLKYVVAGLTDLCCFSAAVESEHPDDPAGFPEQTAIAHKDDSASKTSL